MQGSGYTGDGGAEIQKKTEAIQRFVTAEVVFRRPEARVA